MRSTSEQRTLERYDRARSTPHRGAICNAPLTNLYFSATGAVAPCWILLGRIDESWGPGRSIQDIWTGEAMADLRAAHADREFPGACGRCRSDILSGCAPLAAVYDHHDPPLDQPTTLELELSNRCNFACLMCSGNLSSRIRAEREHRPPLQSPYDDTFVEQVTELVPGLRRIRFSGGEPMMHPIVHAIADRIVDLRPDLRIDVSTNGSLLNAKVRHLLERANVQINVSFESFRADRYERIRPGAELATLLANLDAFQEHFRDHPGLLTINTNPMQQNWDEMPDFVRWCDQRDVFLSFNTVVEPEAFTLRSLPPDELAHVHDTLGVADLGPTDDDVRRHNHAAYAGLLAQLAAWRAAAEGRLPDPPSRSSKLRLRRRDRATVTT